MSGREPRRTTTDAPPAPSVPAGATPAGRRAARRAAAVAAGEAPRPDPTISGVGWFFSRLVIRRWFGLVHEGREHLPRSGPALIVGNHPCYLDPFLVGLGTRRWITWLAWEDAFAWPAVGAVVRGLGALPVNLERPAPSTFKAALATLGEGGLLGLFFEGQRSSGFDLDPPKRGGARLALMAGVPVVPVSVAGARRLWPLDRPLPARPGTVVVRYHPPIDPREVAPGAPRAAREEALTERIVAAIRRGLPPDGRHRW